MRNSTIHSRQGFSLIEVLLAVVILSFGLLSLATLQGALFKASAEAKAQSVALALAAEKLDYFRGYKTTAAFQAFADGSDTPTTPDTNDIAYSRTWDVQRFAYPGTGNFGAVADTGATASGYVTNNEFKRIAVTVSWTDAQGASQHVTLEDAIAALSPADSAKVAKISSTGTVRGPKIRIWDPSSEAGVIPIAIGDNTDTAATNPKPEVAGNNNNQRVIETRFDVLTYGTPSGGTALAQSRVETAVAGCTCDYANADATDIAKRPTYWNGIRYVAPENASYTPRAGEASLNNNEAQSALCTACCRDHHDPASVTGAKFDPRNANHGLGHFLLNTSTGALGSLTTSGQYTEACRLIRVDGYFRVAADMYDDYSNLLETRSDGTATGYLPKTSATTNYQNFVLSYLDARDVTPTSGVKADYNHVLPTTDVGTVTTLESANSLNPATTDITASDTKWGHFRGLYVDYLEDEAVQAIVDARNNCSGTGGASPTTAQLRTCVLKVLPFTSINLTELGNWTPATGTQIVVTNGEFKTSTDTSPVRGKVLTGTSPTPNTTTNDQSSIRRSNSGLTTQVAGIDTDDAATWSDTQPYRVLGTTPSGGAFNVTFGNYTFGATTASYPTIGVVPTAVCNYASSGSTRPNPYNCTSGNLSGSQVLTIGHYNTQSSVKKTSLSCTNTATGIATSHTFSGQGKTINVCTNYSISSASGGGSVGVVANPGKIGESTVVTYASGISAGNTVNMTMQLDSSTDSYTCTYTGSTYTVTPVTCP